MRPGMPPRTEHADALKPRLQRAHDGYHKPRLQMLERLASGHTPTRQEVARVLGLPAREVYRQVLPTRA